MILKLDTTPYAARNKGPKAGEYIPAPIYYGNMTLPANGFPNAAGGMRNGHQHWIVVANQNLGTHETGTNVCERNSESAFVSQLLKSFDVGFLQSLTGRIGRDGAEAFRSGNR